MQKKLKIKKDDTVKVIAGASKGMTGKVIAVNRDTDRITVEGVNIVKKHTKPNAANPQGGIVEQEASIHISNVMYVGAGEATRIGRKRDENGNNVRYAKKTGEVID